MEKTYWFYSCNGKKVGIFLVTVAFFLCKILVKYYCYVFISSLMFSELEITKIYLHE